MPSADVRRTTIRRDGCPPTLLLHALTNLDTAALHAQVRTRLRPVLSELASELRQKDGARAPATKERQAHGASPDVVRLRAAAPAPLR
ncbi:hypothetical protein ACIBBE_25725 [Streptomyces sp. NPDC051644]|uniref:hypothetical protein n=1 Tax=Streptomyces sp. NPDC051644 TaxID=3365666 RepID=UPI00378FB968